MMWGGGGGGQFAVALKLHWIQSHFRHQCLCIATCRGETNFFLPCHLAAFHRLKVRGGDSIIIFAQNHHHHRIFYHYHHQRYFCRENVIFALRAKTMKICVTSWPRSFTSSSSFSRSSTLQTKDERNVCAPHQLRSASGRFRHSNPLPPQYTWWWFF